jgi:hypothetical protein
VAQLYSRALGSLFVASYDSQGYGGGIRTRLHAATNCNRVGVGVGVSVILRLAVYRQSVPLGAKPLENYDEDLIFATEPLQS